MQVLKLTINKWNDRDSWDHRDSGARLTIYKDKQVFALIKVDWLIKQDQQLDIEIEKYCNNKTGNYVLGSQPASK